MYAEEIALFTEKRAGWLPEREGQWAVIRGQTLLGCFPTIEAAYAAAIETWGEGRGALFNAADYSVSSCRSVATGVHKNALR